ncbi:acyl-CoA dehydrogenase family protein [Sphingobium phenoxybenzoativorans]|jgi:3-hydroxy-9,10-secoandrosta-1,3,5(10)-triene-9,17-dione monooxygenase|uniref:Acyl-CoA dehydrogenase family protein n=1 Tax=Sphingobium phenoxybenzoativorans TaxID=1592790 RepID=A0A975K9D6_9SPHN|nr:acyl-CoA dehydrogenase family protein [Sphingobium phenoxybenzoativorans]QUT07216.1 acyl-CoA dehydrogenase family protein [Sphingobium phenoxybenzoativorans]
MSLTMTKTPNLMASAPESHLTPADMISRAKDISAMLVERQAETEERGYYAEDTHRLFQDAGFYRCCVPKRFGGYGFDLPTYVEIMSWIATGCSSTAWQLCLGAGHAITVATFYPAEAQAEIFGDGHFVAASTVKPTVIAGRSADGNWILNGTANFASGSPYSTHFLGYAIEEGADPTKTLPMTYVAPRSSWELLDDWGNTLGLRGSGSHSVRFTNGIVPASHVLPHIHAVSAAVTGGTTGSTLHDNPLYAGRQGSAYSFEASAIYVGMLRAATSLYGDLMKSRNTILPPNMPRAANEDFQRYYGELLHRLHVAETLVRGAAQQWMHAARENMAGTADFSMDTDARISALSGEVARICWGAISEILLPTVGPRDLTRNSRLTRLYRDASMARSHPFSSMFMGSSQRILAAGALLGE